MIVTSSDFHHNGMMPKRHTGFGEDQSPELIVKEIPDQTVCLAVIMEDLDVPLVGILPHWLIWNITVDSVIPGGISGGKIIDTPIHAVQGKAWGKHIYRGPKQPPFVRKAHRYRFSVYALDVMLDISPDSSRDQLMRAMSDHILDKAELIGIYDPKAN